ncbi:hypothetical protein D9757_008534 [Collybiopsis confluens]|uniref:Coiled-coil domain-containing protein 16 n=1 Tax=Collybiopsis confluens TaxID=2823264 RepID=A0A8H5H2S2_9AGAR|nr:hypothetical protein D9757_008534 [Collybiopsis confluens]
MADVRALLKAKRQEARITHPLASYNQSGQLKCTACGVLVKHASAWEGHLLGKQHRSAQARLREQERAKEEQRLRENKGEQERLLQGKRKAEDDITMQEEETVSEAATKRPRLDESSTGFPDDFFSDLSRSLPIPENDSDDEEPQQTEAAPVALAEPTSLDLEWEQFQRDVVNAPSFKDTYENATIVAEPVLNTQTMEGFPTQESSDLPLEPEKMKEEETRRHKELEERELIMDRLLEEERAQEEADMKVVAMKNRLELVRKKREAVKAAKERSSKAPP